MYWDGIKFFGFAETKLSRLRGYPAKYGDKYSSGKTIIELIIIITIVLYVIYTQLKKVIDRNLKS
jgi:hypothetical protein